jgi:hypothetical protein
MMKTTLKEKDKAKKQDAGRMRTYLLLGLVVVLLMFSAVQAVQISALEKSMEMGPGSVTAAATSSPARAVQAPTPAMVGGC